MNKLVNRLLLVWCYVDFLSFQDDFKWEWLGLPQLGQQGWFWPLPNLLVYGERANSSSEAMMSTEYNKFLRPKTVAIHRWERLQSIFTFNITKISQFLPCGSQILWLSLKSLLWLCISFRVKGKVLPKVSSPTWLGLPIPSWTHLLPPLA